MPSTAGAAGARHAVAPQPDSDHDGSSSLEERAYLEIQRMLVRLEIPPTSALDDTELAERLGMGRTPVRRALKRLALEGLVNIYPRRGTFATDISLESLTKLTDLRMAIEGLAAEKAAENAADGDTSRLQALRDQVVEARDEGDVERIFDIFKSIHTEIYALADNPYLTRVAVAHYQLSYRLWYAFERRLKPLGDHSQFYLQLVDAILRRDPPRARDLASQHVLDFRDEVRSGL